MLIIYNGFIKRRLQLTLATWSCKVMFYYILRLSLVKHYKWPGFGHTHAHTHARRNTCTHTHDRTQANTQPHSRHIRLFTSHNVAECSKRIRKIYLFFQLSVLLKFELYSWSSIKTNNIIEVGVRFLLHNVILIINVLHRIVIYKYI